MFVDVIIILCIWWASIERAYWFQWVWSSAPHDVLEQSDSRILENLSSLKGGEIWFFSGVRHWTSKQLIRTELIT